jgi:hypothetical protein
VTVEVITSAEGWRSALAQLGPHDFVHTYDFHAASEANGDGTPIAFALRDSEGRTQAFWPLLLRAIHGGEDFDLTSVYGYAGPLFHGGATPDAPEALLDGMAKHGAVSVFSRLHPLFDDGIRDDPGKKAIGEVVSIEVSPDDDPPKSYRTNHKRNIAKMLAQGFTTTVASDAEAFRRFQPLYEAAMDDLEASKSYYFSESFYEGIREASDFRSFIIFAEFGGREVAAVLFTVSGNIMQYFLSATLQEFRQAAPSKLIIAAAHRMAAEEGLKHLVLGGGVGGCRDNLFHFKYGFSKCVRTQHIFRRILDPERYAALCVQKGINSAGTDFFPAYRAEP